MLIKKLLTCTDSIVVEALKVLNRVAIETCFPCNPTIQEREGRWGGGAYLKGGVCMKLWPWGLGTIQGSAFIKVCLLIQGNTANVFYMIMNLENMVNMLT